MKEAPDPQADRQREDVAEFIRATSALSPDIVRISDDTWAIYGDIPVDGEVILAEFGSYAEARNALDGLSTS